MQTFLEACRSSTPAVASQLELPPFGRDCIPSSRRDDVRLPPRVGHRDSDASPPIAAVQTRFHPVPFANA